MALPAFLGLLLANRTVKDAPESPLEDVAADETRLSPEALFHAELIEMAAAEFGTWTSSRP